MVVIYGKEGCSYCDKSKEHLDIEKIEYEYIDLSDNQSLIERVKTLYPKAKTLPVVIIDDVWIGGYNELVKYTEKNFTNGKRILIG